MHEAFRPEAVLGSTEHRPYPVPSGPWVLRMSWRDLLFMHWPVEVEELRPLVPPALSIDTFERSAWLGVVPFDMSGVRPRFLPAVPGLSHFPEINLRTYVTAEGRPGIWFFSLDAHSRLAVRLARVTFRLPYFDAEMSCRVTDDEVHYRSVRTHGGALQERTGVRRELPDRALLPLQRRREGRRSSRRGPSPVVAPPAGRGRGPHARHDAANR